jgi:hypothetical protein
MFIANERNQSTATADPATQRIRRDVTITVTLRDANGDPIAGHSVALATGSSSTQVTIAATTDGHGDPSTGAALTDSAGQVHFTLSDTAAERLAISVTDSTTDATLYRQVVVYFTRH